MTGCVSTISIFEATGGGIVFGGLEPLLQAGFIADFIDFAREKGANWKFSLETSLAVPTESVALLDGKIDRYFVDVKDMNDAVYRAYTGCSSADMKRNLSYLASRVPQCLSIRVPLIPDFNTDADRDRSCASLREMGLSDIERFSYLIR